MASVNWSFQALEDIADISEFHAQNSESYASFLVKQFFARAEQLENFPFSGRVVPESNLKSVRELIVNGYRIIYSVSSNVKIEILAVRHSSRPLINFPIETNE